MFDTFSDLNISETVKSIFNTVKIPHEIKRNFKAHDKLVNWVFYEHLYTDIDKILFQGKNDFQRLIRSTFPALKTDCLTKGQWQAIRRIIGRPRRMSDTFLSQERTILNDKRFKIVNLQNIILGKQLFDLSVIDFINTSETVLPNTSSIPHSIPNDTLVIIKFASYLNGIYEGKVKGPSYEPGFYDIEILRPIIIGSTTKRIPLNKIVSKVFKIQEFFIFRKDNSETEYFTIRKLKEKITETPDNRIKILDNSAEMEEENEKNEELEKDFFQKTNLFMTMVKLNKALYEKRRTIAIIREMNDFVTENSTIVIDINFQREYAAHVIHLTDMNSSIKNHLMEISSLIDQSYQSIYKKPIRNAIDWRRKSTDEAIELVNRCRGNCPNPSVDDKRTKFIVRLISLLTIMSNISECQDNSEFHSIDELIQEIRDSLDSSNIKIYEQNVIPLVSQLLKSISPEWENFRQPKTAKILTPNQMYNRPFKDQRFVFK